MTAILAIDQGTSSTKALLVDPSGHAVARSSAAVGSNSPRPGWVEQDPGELWRSVLAAIHAVLDANPEERLAGIAISNQRETVIAWDGPGGPALSPAISWQDQRGAAACRSLATPANVSLVRRLSGLGLESMYSASKIAWLMDQHGDRPNLRVGTVDAWLLDHLTGGAVYATDAGNAGRTLLCDIRAQAWSARLCGLFGINPARLPEIRSSTGPWGTTLGAPGVPDGIPILAVMGDSHAALYGHWALAPGYTGLGKATYGTGASVMMPISDPDQRQEGVSTVLAWRSRTPMWAVEGNILYAGAGMDWLAGTLGVTPGEEFSALAGMSADTGGAVFVPALNGLGAPWWDPSAVGTLTGLTAGTTRAAIARAGVEAVAQQVCDVVDVMDPDRKQAVLHAGGGASASPLLMQTQADLLGRTLLVCRTPDVSAVGTAALAFEAGGIDFDTADDMTPRSVTPSTNLTPLAREERRDDWRLALARSRAKAPDRRPPEPTETTSSNRETSS
jgi:glycerol kinase